MMENYNEHIEFKDPHGLFHYEYFKLNNNLHRTDGPAYIYRYQNRSTIHEKYCINGKLHRVDGPADIISYSDKEPDQLYFLLGEGITEEQFHTPGFIDAFILENS